MATSWFHRRDLLMLFGAWSAALVLGRVNRAGAQVSSQAAGPLPAFTGPEANPYWNGVNPFVTYPQKLPLLRLTDRGIQLETPRQYFDRAFTPNPAFYVRYHLELIPNSVDLGTWRLHLEGNFDKPMQLSFEDLVRNFPAVSIAAVNQCSGNSRSRFQPRVSGGQWGNGAMGNALWTGVHLADLLRNAGAKPGTVQFQFEGLERGPGPVGKGSHAFLKSLEVNDPVLNEAVVAYLMNGEPLPMLNGFPLRLVVPGIFSTYWIKHLTWIRALTQEDKNFWMDPAYRMAQRHRPVDRTALTPLAGLAGHVARVRHVDQRPHAPRRRAARLNRRALKPQRSWHAISIMGPPELGLIQVWVGLLVGLLVLAWPGVSAAWPALDRPRTSGDNAVSPLLDDRDLEDDSRAALARRTTRGLGLSPATIKGHAAVMSSHCWPPRYFVRPQLLTRFSPLPMGRDLRASIE